MKNKLTSSSKLFTFRLLALVKHPMFGILTFVGNGTILCAALVFYYLEYPSNPKVGSFIDALWWSVSTCTTVGGDIFPRSFAGRILGMIMMIFGTALFCSFTALFSSVLMSPRLDQVEEEVKALATEVGEDEIVFGHLISKLESTLKDLTSMIKNRKKL